MTRRARERLRRHLNRAIRYYCSSGNWASSAAQFRTLLLGGFISTPEHTRTFVRTWGAYEPPRPRSLRKTERRARRAHRHGIALYRASDNLWRAHFAGWANMVGGHVDRGTCAQLAIRHFRRHVVPLYRELGIEWRRSRCV